MIKWDKDAEKAAPTKMNVSIKIIFDPTSTLMKILMTLDEDTASLLLSSFVAAQSDAPPKQLQQWLRKKSKLARSGNESTPAAVRPPSAHRVLHDVTVTTAKDIFPMSQDTIHLKRPTEVEFANMWDAMNRMDELWWSKGAQRPTIN